MLNVGMQSAPVISLVHVARFAKADNKDGLPELRLVNLPDVLARAIDFSDLWEGDGLKDSVALGISYCLACGAGRSGVNAPNRKLTAGEMNTQA
ncbi:unnamed protein product [Caretta caretta]